MAPHPAHAPLATASTGWQQRLTRAWLSRNLLTRLLWPLSQVYGALVAVRAWRYRRGLMPTERMPVPVVIVGNVVVGGAGKTPTTVAIVRHLQAMGHRPGVVSRGHGRQVSTHVAGADVVHVQADTPAQDAGDEPLLIHAATGAPVVVARQRVHAAQALLAAHPDTTVLVCDDGLQHLALHADVAVAVFDERGVGNGWLLPAGLLREPWPTRQAAPALPAPTRSQSGPARQVHLVLQASAHAPGTPLPCPTGAVHAWAHKQLAHEAVDMTGRRVALADLLHQAQLPWAAWAGIANPEGFFAMLREAGVPLARTLSLNDHQGFEGELCSTLLNEYERYGVFCTEKDAVKLFPLLRSATASSAQDATGWHGPAVWAVPLTFAPEPAFFRALEHRLSLFNGHQTA